MTDIELKKPLAVRNEGKAGPYLLVSIEQIEEVESVLSGAKIPYLLSREAVEFEGHHAIAMIDFGRRADPSTIQAALDSAP